jgi:xanthine dehydrogenase accessory factor
VGLDLGHTSHREIAVAILAELVQLRATGALLGGPGTLTPSASTTAAVTEAFDPVCGMRVRAGRSSHPVEHGGTTYYFCSVGCRDVFAEDPDTIVSSDYADRGQ